MVNRTQDKRMNIHYKIGNTYRVPDKEQKEAFEKIIDDQVIPALKRSDPCLQKEHFSSVYFNDPKQGNLFINFHEDLAPVYLVYPYKINHPLMIGPVETITGYIEDESMILPSKILFNKEYLCSNSSEIKDSAIEMYLRDENSFNVFGDSSGLFFTANPDVMKTKFEELGIDKIVNIPGHTTLDIKVKSLIRDLEGYNKFRKDNIGTGGTLSLLIYDAEEEYLKSLEYRTLEYGR